jgi:hypothetical protein
MDTPRHRRVPAALIAGAALALTGCATGTTPAAPPATAPAVEIPTEQTVAWTDSVCGALVPVAENLADPPEFDLTAPAATRDAFVAYLTQAQAATDRALEGVAAAGSAPVDGGDQVAEDVRADLTELRDDLGDARTQLEQADASDAAAVGRSAVAAGNVVGALGNQAQTLSALDGSPRLDAAFEQAASCEQLRAVQTPGR